MLSKEIRQKFLEFFEMKGHKVVLSSSLIPADPTVLLTTAGMQQFVPYLSGENEPPYRRACSVQKCFRTADIDEVGNEIHHTFFEMLGNWSFGDYWKEEAINYALELLTTVYQLSLKRLWITVFKGENDIPRDEEAIELWIKVGISKERIREFGMNDNFWGPVELKGPCGPCSEIHYDRGKEFIRNKCSIKNCGPNCNCGRFMEIWNLVFMEYYKDENTYKLLGQKNIDTGIGFERLVAILQKKSSAYETDLFLPFMPDLELKDFLLKARRIIADHIRGACFLVADGVLPSREDRGYILRRILRRAIRYGRLLKMPKQFLIPIASKVIEIYQDVYPELKQKQNDILTVIQREGEQFEKTLEKGLKEFEKKIIQLSNLSLTKLSGEDAFHLYDTYGFPLELTKEMAKEKKIEVDEEEFKKAFEKHQKISRAGLEKKFGGTGIDKIKDEISKKKITRLHTATHLLHQALRNTLGNHVKQMGSDINSERLRFDFSHFQKLTEEEKKRIEELVNQKIKEDLLVISKKMDYEKALKDGALAFFKEKYPKIVKVYSIEKYSKEICAGPHVRSTGEIGRFRIISEKSSGAGIRRIKGRVEEVYSS